LLALALVASRAAATEGGTLTGTINNRATGDLLEGAKVVVPQLGISALTDNTGRYVLPNLPAGTHEVVASYVGLDAMRGQVAITPGHRVVRDFDLTTGIYKLDAFKVTGELEGGAAAITAQRNADNVKNVVAMDQFGNLPNLNAAEVAARLPGVVGFLAVAATVNGFTIRGMDRGLNSVTMEGAMHTGQGAIDRTSIVNHLPAKGPSRYTVGGARGALKGLTGFRAGIGVEEVGQLDTAALRRYREELAWRLDHAREHRIIFSVEAHVGSIVPTPQEAGELVRMTPGLTLTLDYTHFTKVGLPDSAIEPLVKYASHFHNNKPGVEAEMKSISGLDFTAKILAKEGAHLKKQPEWKRHLA